MCVRVCQCECVVYVCVCQCGCGYCPSVCVCVVCVCVRFEHVQHALTKKGGCGIEMIVHSMFTYIYLEVEVKFVHFVAVLVLCADREMIGFWRPVKVISGLRSYQGVDQGSSK